MRWNAPNDNGAHIQHYILEEDRTYQPTYGLGSACNVDAYSSPSRAFVEVFRGRSKNFNMTKLQSSTTYRFRLIAESELGRSRPSEIVAFQTQGTAPPKPCEPGLREATKSSLHLVWSKRLTDSEFVLHMDDQISGHGFLPIYNGPETSHISTGLRRNAAYKFRLQVNYEGFKIIDLVCFESEQNSTDAPDYFYPILIIIKLFVQFCLLYLYLL